MELTLASIGLAIGVVGAVISHLIAAFGAPGRETESRPRVSAPLSLGLVLTVALFLLSLPTAPPFSAGQRLGWGILIGGLAGLITAFGCARTMRPQAGFWPYPAGWTFSLTVAAVSLTLLLFRGDPGDALAGCALGFVLVAGVFRVMTPSGASSAEKADDSALTLTLEAGAVLAVTLAAGSVLAVYHFNSDAQRGWWAYLPAVGAFWVLGHVAAYAALAQQRFGKSPLVMVAAGVLGIILVLAAAGLLGSRMEPPQSVQALLIAGLVTAALMAWLAIAGSQDEQEWPSAVKANALMGGLVLLLVVLSFKLLAGFGSAVALTAGWAIVGALVAAGRQARAPVLALAAGASYLLLRLFVERSGAAVGEAEMAVHYALIGAIAGMALPFIYCALYMRAGVRRALLVGGLGALSPLALLALWGPDAVLGLLAGLVAAQVLAVMLVSLDGFSSQVAGRAPLAAWQGPVGLLCLGTGLVAAQCSRAFLFLYQMPRSGKSYIAAGIAVVVVLWIIGIGLARWRRGAHPAQAAPPTGEEG